jgi:hypothetical protein
VAAGLFQGAADHVALEAADLFVEIYPAAEVEK